MQGLRVYFADSFAIRRAPPAGQFADHGMEDHGLAAAEHGPQPSAVERFREFGVDVHSWTCLQREKADVESTESQSGWKHTGTVLTLSLTNRIIGGGTYTAVDLAPFVLDSSAGAVGRVVVLGAGRGTVFVVR